MKNKTLSEMTLTEKVRTFCRVNGLTLQTNRGNSDKWISKGEWSEGFEGWDALALFLVNCKQSKELGDSYPWDK